MITASASQRAAEEVFCETAKSSLVRRDPESSQSRRGAPPGEELQGTGGARTGLVEGPGAVGAASR